MTRFIIAAGSMFSQATAAVAAPIIQTFNAPDMGDDFLIDHDRPLHAGQAERSRHAESLGRRAAKAKGAIANALRSEVPVSKRVRGSLRQSESAEAGIERGYHSPLKTRC